MEPVNSYWGMLQTLADGFCTRYKRHDVNITGILFARPVSPFAQKEILPHIDYWHHRSDYYTDFFCPGYLRDDSGQSGPVVATVGGKWSSPILGLSHSCRSLSRILPGGIAAAVSLSSRTRVMTRSPNMPLWIYRRR
jgi:hypothetical protein